MQEKYYIYNNPILGYNYKVCGQEEIVGSLANITVVLCSSSFWAENPENFQRYFNNGTKFIIPNCVSEEIDNKIKSGEEFFKASSNKKFVLQNCEKIITNATSIYGECDAAPTQAAKGEAVVVFCANDHEAAIALHNATPYIYIISKSEIERCNGPYNCRLPHIKNIKNLEKLIK